MKEAKTDLVGIAVFDHLEKDLQSADCLIEIMWSCREIENYFCSEEVLLAYARHELIHDDLFGHSEIQQREQAMRESNCRGHGGVTDAK